MICVSSKVRITGNNINDLIAFSKGHEKQSIAQWSGIDDSFPSETIEYSTGEINIYIVSKEEITNHLKEISRLFNVVVDCLYQYNDNMELTRIHIAFGVVKQEVRLNMNGLIVLGEK